MPAAPSWDPAGAYTVAFSDDFNGTALDQTKWSTGWFGQGISGPINGAETAVYSNTHISVSGGNLNLLLTPTSSRSGFPNTGACVTTNPNGGASVGFQMLYGAVEWRAFVNPTGAGNQAANWCALWMDGQSWPTDGEFDVIEALHGSIEWHCPTDGNPGGGGPAEPYTGWHTFGVNWPSGSNVVTFYYDGIRVGSFTRTRTSQPMYLICNNTVGTNSVAYVPAGGITFMVDWVYAWKPGGSPPVTHSGAPSTGITITPSATGGPGTGGIGGSSPSTGITITPSAAGTAVGASQTSLFYRAPPAVTSSDATTETAWSVAKQAGTSPGDWIFIYAYGGGSAVHITGFTTIADAGNFSCLMYRRADGTEGSSFALTGLYTGRPITTVIATVAGAASALDPVTLTTPVNASGATSIPVGSITLAGATDWVLWFAGDQNGWAGAGYAITPPAGFTSRATNGASAAGSTVMLADDYTRPAGATGTETGTITNTAGVAGVMVGLAPGAQVKAGSPSTGISVIPSAIGQAVQTNSVAAAVATSFTIVPSAAGTGVSPNVPNMLMASFP